MMEKDTYFLLNGEQLELYAIESMIRGLSTMKNTMCFGLFSCGKLMMGSFDKQQADNDIEAGLKMLRETTPDSFNKERDQRYMLAFKNADMNFEEEDDQ